jgi:hypothetical protein
MAELQNRLCKPADGSDSGAATVIPFPVAGTLETAEGELPFIDPRLPLDQLDLFDGRCLSCGHDSHNGHCDAPESEDE